MDFPPRSYHFVLQIQKKWKILIWNQRHKHTKNIQPKDSEWKKRKRLDFILELKLKWKCYWCGMNNIYILQYARFLEPAIINKVFMQALYYKILLPTHCATNRQWKEQKKNKKYYRFEVTNVFRWMKKAYTNRIRNLRDFHKTTPTMKKSFGKRRRMCVQKIKLSITFCNVFLWMWNVTNSIIL